MESSNNGDLKISGTGSTSGGLFNNVSISGTGNITGDLDCNNFSISGCGNVTGALKAQNAKISGTANISGDVTCSQKFKISGSSKLGGNLKAEQVQFSGSVKIDGDCNAEEFNGEGCFKIGGMLNSEKIELELAPWKSSAVEIGCGKIKITSTPIHRFVAFIKSTVTGNSFILETGTIEGDDIYLEGTKAAIVRGGNVKIGSGCEIGLVEYSINFEQTGTAIVKESKKI